MPSDDTISSLNLNNIISSLDSDRIDRANNEINLVKFKEPGGIEQGGAENIQDVHDIIKNKPVSLHFEVSGKHNYEVDIRFQESLSFNSPIKLKCQCADFKYRWANVLYSYRALYAPTTFDPKVLSQEPNKTNPNADIRCCKHIISTVKVLQNENVLR